MIFRGILELRRVCFLTLIDFKKPTESHSSRQFVAFLLIGLQVPLAVITQSAPDGLRIEMSAILTSCRHRVTKIVTGMDGVHFN